MAGIADDKGATGGRKEIDLTQLEALGRIQCTIEEAAGVLRVSKSTLELRLKDDAETREAWDRGLAGGKTSLRRRMWQIVNDAKNPSAAGNMAIHLSKHWLGMSEKSLMEHSGPGGQPLAVEPLRVVIAAAPDKPPQPANDVKSTGSPAIPRIIGAKPKSA